MTGSLQVISHLKIKIYLYFKNVLKDKVRVGSLNLHKYL